MYFAHKMKKRTQVTQYIRMYNSCVYLVRLAVNLKSIIIKDRILGNMPFAYLLRPLKMS